jgi:PAS domain S-box-containing protein
MPRSFPEQTRPFRHVRAAARDHGRLDPERAIKLDAIAQTQACARRVPGLNDTQRFHREECTVARKIDIVIRIKAIVGQRLTVVKAIVRRAESKEGRNASPNRFEAINRSILDSALDCIISMDARGIVREFNRAAEQTFGYKREEAVGRELAELIIPPPLRPLHREGLARFLKTGEGPVIGRRIEINGVRKDRSEILVELAINATKIDNEPFFTAYLRDITERHRRDLALRRLAAIVESSEDAIIGTDLEMRITSWNKGAERLFGYTAAEAVGQTVLLLIPQDRQQEEPQILERIRRGERVEHYETLRQHKDGTLLNISLTVSPIKDAQGHVVGASKSARDITARVRGDRRRLAQYAVASVLAGSRTLEDASWPILQMIASISGWVYAGLWVIDESAQRLRCTTFWQAGSEKLEKFGNVCASIQFSAGEGLPGRIWQANEPAWIHDVLLDPNFPRMPHAKEAGLRGAFAFPLFADHRVNGVIELLSHELVEPDKDLLQFVTALGSQIGIFIEQRRVEEELAQAKANAEAANAAKDKFLAMLSHELRTPLTPVLLWAEGMASDPKLEGELRDGLKMICRNIELEARLVDDLLDLTRITRGKLQLQLGHVDLHEIVRNAFEIVRGEMQDRHLHVEMELKAQPHECSGDGPRLQQVFWNLFRNAYKFSALDGEIRVRTFNRENKIIVEIADKGLGIEPRYLEKIFDAFEQIDAQRGGLGLGLAITKVILEMHGGSISARSEGLGLGATFTVELPAG